jgi:peptidoglycan/LPS O-acetylase OafA/YrhL
MNQKQQIKELFIVRALAILGVIMVHATSYATVELATSSSLYPLYNFLNRFFAFGTATFIFLSAFVLFYSYYNRVLDKQLLQNFYLNRLKYIVLPYVIFSLIYYVVVVFPLSPDNNSFSGLSRDFLLKLATGKAYDHLYFIFVLIQFDLLFPFLLWLFQKQKGLVKHGLWIGFAIQWAFVFLNSYYFRITVGTGSIALSYMSYYFLGAFAGVYYPQFVSWFKGWKTCLLGILWLLFGYLYVWIYYVMRVENIYYNAKWYTLFWNLYAYMAALVLLLLSFWLFKRFPAWLINGLIRLGASSFGIYLFHMLVLRFYRKFDFSGIPWLYHISIFGGFLCALLISWIVVVIVNRYFPCAWTIFGRSPKQLPLKDNGSPYDSRRITEKR